MRQYYRKVNLPESNYQECLDIISKVENYMYSLYPDAKRASVWCITENNISFAMFYNPETRGLDGKEIQEVSWESTCLNVPELVPFCKKYNLEHTFAKGFDNVYYPHRHTYPATSRWSFTFLQKNADNGIVSFYSSKDESSHAESDFQLRADDGIVLDQVIMDNGDLYSFDTWQWHNWIPKYEKSEYAVFALKNAQTADDMNNIVDGLESGNEQFL